eukprot:COSAG01_NODE_333_length_18717_cov_40.372072_1_plen_578_part_00
MPFGPSFRPSSAPALRGVVLMPRKSDWTALEDAALKEAYAQQLEQLGRQPKGVEWDPIVAALPAREEGLPARSRKAAQGRALDGLKLREKVERKKRGADWFGDDHRRGGKDAKRKAQSPAVSPADGPPKKRQAAVDAEAALVAIRKQLVADLELNPGLLATGLLSEAAKRKAWAHYFVDTLGFPGNEDGVWDKKGDGTVSQICKMFQVPKGSRASVRSVLEDVTACASDEIEYTGARGQVARARANISIESFEAQLIADYMEDDYSLHQTKEEINFYREWHDEDGNELSVSTPRSVGLKSIWSCYEAMKPVESAVLDATQGNDDITSPWAKARFCWITFVLVSFGVLTYKELRFIPWENYCDDYKRELAARKAMLNTSSWREGLVLPPLPPWADPAVVTQVKLNQLAWADGVHKKPITAGQGHDAYGSKREIRFYRNDDGWVVDPSDPQAKIRDRKAQMKCKYTKESRFLCIGMIRENMDGTEEPQRLPTFVYSCCWLNSIRDFMGEIGGTGGKRATQIQYVKEHGAATNWVTNRRPDGVIYSGDPITVLPRVTDAMALELGSADSAKNSKVSPISS